MKKHVTALALLTCATLVLDAAAQRAQVGAGHNFLSLDNVPSGFLRQVEGGAISAEVVEQSQGIRPAAKHLGQLRYEPFTVQFGFSPAEKALHSWIAASWNQDYQRKNGAIIATDYQMNARSQREFYHALITESTFPACDGASREPGFISLKFAPEYTRMSKASGKVSGEIVRTQSKAWLPANFRLRIDGLDCTRVVRIESFTVKHTVASQAFGTGRDYDLEPAGIEFPNLKITLGAATAQTWQDWFETFVVAGKNGSDDEKQGTLEFLSSDRQEVLATIRFEGLGIFRLEEAGSQSQADAVSRYTAELYCERMSFIPGNGKP